MSPAVEVDAFYTSIGYEVLGDVPATDLGTLTMLKLSGDEFVAPNSSTTTNNGRVEPGGLSHLVDRPSHRRSSFVPSLGWAYPWVSCSVCWRSGPSQP